MDGGKVQYMKFLSAIVLSHFVFSVAMAADVVERASVKVQSGSCLSLRSGPGRVFSKKDCVTGSDIKVLEWSPGGYSKVSVGGKTGFVSSAYLVPRVSGALSSVPVVKKSAAPVVKKNSPPAVVSAPVQLAKVKVKSGSCLNFRSGPSQNSSIVSCSSGSKIKVLEWVPGGFSKVSLAGREVYASTDYLIPGAVPSEKDADSISLNDGQAELQSDEVAESDGEDKESESKKEAPAKAGEALGRMLYIGDSQTGAPGVPRIGAALKCLNDANIHGFSNSRSTTYLGGSSCTIPDVYNRNDQHKFKPPNTNGMSKKEKDRALAAYRKKISDFYCQLAKKRFDSALERNSSQVDTVVVALGDNPSRDGFERMLSAIVNSGKKCIWVMPSLKSNVSSQTNAITESSRRNMKPIAERICGAQNVIDPSAGGKRFAVIDLDHTHYTRSAGAQIGGRICDGLRQRASASRVRKAESADGDPAATK